MKKLKLKALELGANELFTREQFKNAMAGEGSSSGCPTGQFQGTCISNSAQAYICVATVSQCWNFC